MEAVLRTVRSPVVIVAVVPVPVILRSSTSMESALTVRAPPFAAPSLPRRSIVPTSMFRMPCSPFTPSSTVRPTPVSVPLPVMFTVAPRTVVSYLKFSVSPALTVKFVSIVMTESVASCVVLKIVLPPTSRSSGLFSVPRVPVGAPTMVRSPPAVRLPDAPFALTRLDSVLPKASVRSFAAEMEPSWYCVWPGSRTNFGSVPDAAVWSVMRPDSSTS